MPLPISGASSFSDLINYANSQSTAVANSFVGKPTGSQTLITNPNKQKPNTLGVGLSFGVKPDFAKSSTMPAGMADAVVRYKTLLGA